MLTLKCRINAVPGVNSTLTNTDEIAPDAMRPEASIVTRNTMIGAIVGSVAMVGLVLFGVIFFLRRRMNKTSPRRAGDTARTVSNVTYSVSSHIVMGQLESGMIAQGQNPFLNRSGGSIRDSTLAVASVQGQCSQPGRYSHISASSQNSRSMRFAVSGSYRNSSHSHSSRATMSVMVIDVAHSLTVDPSADPVSPQSPVPPRSPVSVNANTDYSASWRGTNLSNIINAARGIKT